MNSKKNDELTDIYGEECITIPLFCPVCDFSIIPERDFSHYKKFLCCSHCAMKWAESRRDKWKNGWRPSVDEILSEEPIRRRQFSSFYF